MIFQILDDKKDCHGIYTNGEFIYGDIPERFNKTWNYSDHLNNRWVDYGYLWSGGKSLKEACPEHLKQRFDYHENKIKSHFKSFSIAKINFDDICFYDVVPQKHLEHYFEIKNEICDWIFKNLERPPNYTFLLESYQTIQDISKNPVHINLHKLYKWAKTDLKAKQLLTWLQGNSRPIVNYNLFGSVTGRLTTKPGSFPIMNLKTE